MTTVHEYAINEKKQIEINQLNSQVAKAQYQVNQLQAVVNALTQKNSDFLAALAAAQTNRNTAASNFDQVQKLAANIKDMTGKVCTTVIQTFQSDMMIKITAGQVAILIDQLIYSAEMIDKLSLLINKKKLARPVISSDLVATITAASDATNSVIALTLDALSNCYLALASGTEADKVTLLECQQSIDLYTLITGDDSHVAAITTELKHLKHLACSTVPLGEDQQPAAQRKTLQNTIDSFQNAAAGSFTSMNDMGDKAFKSRDEAPSTPLYDLLERASNDAQVKYDAALTNSNNVQTELNQAQTRLNNAMVKLNSLKSGLAAANAAAIM